MSIGGLQKVMDPPGGEAGRAVEAVPKAPTDEELVARAGKGDQRAARELVGRYQTKAYAIAFHLADGDRGEAEDMVQEAFLRVFRSLKRFRGRSSFHTWFHRIVVNTCLDGRRRKGRRERFLSLWRPRQKEPGLSLEEAEEGSDRGQDHNPLAALQSRELSEGVRRAMDDLPERQRLVFQLKVLEGMSIREIGEVIEAAEGTVKSHLFRATRSLREALKDWVRS